MSTRSSARLVGVAALLCATPVRAGPVVVTDDAPAKVALLLGVDAFDDAGWPDLRYTRNDAEALAEQLDSGAGFHTRVLVGREQTTRAAFVRALDGLERAGLRANDTVVVYVSTHGTLSRDLHGDLRQVLVLRDTDHEQPLQSGLPLDELLDRFEALRSRRKVLILATCYAGTGKSSLSETIRGYLAGAKGAIAPPLHDVSNATVILSASTWGEAAREDESLHHDVYTSFLLQALHGYDPNGDGATSVTEAHDFARQRTYRFTGGAQRPTALMTIEGEDPIVLGGRRTADGKPLLLAYRSSFDGFRVVVDGTLKGELPGGLVLAPGWHDVVVERPGDDAKAVLERRVFLRAGDRVDLAALFDREPPLQIEFHGGTWLRGGSARGSDVVALGNISALVRYQDVVIQGIDVSATAGVGLGGDTIRVNQETFAASLLEAQARLGIGTHFVIDPFTVHIDGWGGIGFASTRVDSSYYRDPIETWYGIVGASAALRLRFARRWAVGAGVGADYYPGDPRGFGGNVWLSASLSL